MYARRVSLKLKPNSTAEFAKRLEVRAGRRANPPSLLKLIDGIVNR